IAGQHQREFGAAKGPLGDLHRMPRAVLRLLQNRDGSQRRDHRGHLVSLMTNNNDRIPGFQWLARADNMLYQRAASRAMKNFRQARFKASALSGREDNYG